MIGKLFCKLPGISFGLLFGKLFGKLPVIRFGLLDILFGKLLCKLLGKSFVKLLVNCALEVPSMLTS